MLKEILNENNISVYQLAKETGIAYSTLNDLVNHKVSIENCKAVTLYKLANRLKMTTDELYECCLDKIRIHANGLDSDGIVFVRNKTYWLSFIYQKKEIQKKLSKVNRISTFYVEEMAQWKIEDFLSEKRMEESWNAIYSYEKR